MPVERITDVFISAMYGSIFLNYFSGRSDRFAATAEDIVDVIFRGILTDDELARRYSAGPSPGGVGGPISKN